MWMLTQKEIAQNIKKVNGTSIPFFCKYLYGFPETKAQTDLQACIVTNIGSEVNLKDEFIFIDNFGVNIGSIPRNAISRIGIDKNLLMIAWNIDSSIQNTTVFKFSGSNANYEAQRAAIAISKYKQ